MNNVRVLFHVAADYRLWARDDNEIIRTNVEGTRALMEVAIRAGVERIVYTSSVATLKAQPDGTPSDETSRLEPQSAVGAYKYSKVVAERLVEQMVAEAEALEHNPTLSYVLFEAACFIALWVGLAILLIVKRPQVIRLEFETAAG